MASCEEMTGFNISQLSKLFQLFGLRDCVHAHHETVLLIGTGHFDVDTGAEKCYRIDPEELLLYSLTRIKTGMTQEAIIDTTTLAGIMLVGPTDTAGSCSTLTCAMQEFLVTRGFCDSYLCLENSEMLSRHIARRIGCISIIRAMQLSFPA